MLHRRELPSPAPTFAAQAYEGIAEFCEASRSSGYAVVCWCPPRESGGHFLEQVQTLSDFTEFDAPPGPTLYR
jgi:hypothetical protein